MMFKANNQGPQLSQPNIILPKESAQSADNSPCSPTEESQAVQELDSAKVISDFKLPEKEIYKEAETQTDPEVKQTASQET